MRLGDMTNQPSSAIQVLGLARGLRLLLGIVVLLSGHHAGSLWAQSPLSKKDQQLVKQLASDVEKVTAAWERQRGEAAIKAWAAAFRRLESLKEPSAELIAALRPHYEKLNQHRGELNSAGANLPELPPLTPPTTNNPLEVSFTRDVVPLLMSKCGNCHIRGSRGDVQFAEFAELVDGALVVPRDPVSSRLIQVIDSGEMPKGNNRVSDDELKILRAWIAAGAVNDGDKNSLMSAGSAATNPAPAAGPAWELRGPTGTETVSFSRDVAPVLVESCTGCHLDSNQPRSGLNLGLFNGLLRGGDRGTLLVPGKPAESLLIKKLKGTADGNRMPMGRDPLSAEVIRRIEQWISEGARFDGATPETPTKILAATAAASRMDHAALGEQRLKLAQQNWNKALPGVKPTRLNVGDVQIFSTWNQNDLQGWETRLLTMQRDLKDLWNWPADRPLIKGQMTLYLLSQRYDFNELSTMVLGRPAPKSSNSYGDFSIVDAWGAVLADKNLSEEAVTVEIARSIAAISAAGQASGVPAWFAEGWGQASVEQVFAKTDTVKGFAERAQAAARDIKNWGDVLGGQVSPELVRWGGYRLVKKLQGDNGRFRQLLKELQGGRDFDGAMQTIYGSEWREQLIQAP